MFPSTDTRPIDRERELALAKAMLEGERALFDAVLETGVPLVELVAIAQALRTGTYEVAEVSAAGGGPASSRRWLLARLECAIRIDARLQRLRDPQGSGRAAPGCAGRLEAARRLRNAIVSTVPWRRERVGAITARALRACGAHPAAAVRVLRERLLARKDALVLANLRLVISWARKYAGYGVPLDDLVQEGTIGLMRAVARYEPSVGTRVSTYAVWWIRQAIQRAVRRDVSFAAGDPALLLGAKVGALARERAGVEATPLAVEAATVARQEREHVTRLFAVLSGREQRVVRLRFGLGGGQALSLREIGMEMGLSHERVRHIETAALAKMRAAAPGELPT